jgi:hypothetical protein
MIRTGEPVAVPPPVDEFAFAVDVPATEALDEDVGVVLPDPDELQAAKANTEAKIVTIVSFLHDVATFLNFTGPPLGAIVEPRFRTALTPER